VKLNSKIFLLSLSALIPIAFFCIAWIEKDEPQENDLQFLVESVMNNSYSILTDIANNYIVKYDDSRSVTVVSPKGDVFECDTLEKLETVFAKLNFPKYSIMYVGDKNTDKALLSNDLYRDNAFERQIIEVLRVKEKTND